MIRGKTNPVLVACFGDDCDAKIEIVNGRGFCPVHKMEIRIEFGLQWWDKLPAGWMNGLDSPRFVN